MRNVSRREFLSAASVAGLYPLLPRRTIVSIEPAVRFISDCPLPGETRADDVVPAHPNGLQVARDRWLLLYGTRGFRGVDDDRSSVYQLRKDAPDGPILKEGFLNRTRDDWDPYADGKKFSRQHGHAVGFGVPKGAKIGGKPAPHANVFVAKWYVNARMLDREKNLLEHTSVPIEMGGPKHFIEWAQFRLNEREDDIEILQAPARLRQKGFDSGERFTSAEPVHSMNQSYTPAVPFNRDATEWADVVAFDGGRVAPTRLAWNASSGLYEWIQTGPIVSGGVFEGSLAPHGAKWALSARLEKGGGVAWTLSEDPFRDVPAFTIAKDPATNSPLTPWGCPDGVLRLVTGDKGRRDPLFLWDIDPADGFRASNGRVLFDSVKAGLKIRPASQPKIDMGKLLPPSGRTQLALFRVSVRSFNHPYPNRSTIPVIDADEKAACGIYAARITYAEAAPSRWEF
jgi:hypothetical protein